MAALAWHAMHSGVNLWYSSWFLQPLQEHDLLLHVWRPPKVHERGRLPVLDAVRRRGDADVHRGHNGRHDEGGRLQERGGGWYRLLRCPGHGLVHGPDHTSVLLG